MNQRNFFAELKRRNVYKVAVAYAVVAWLLIQAASILFPTFEAPTWVMKIFVAVIVLGFPLALVLSWAFEITPEGIKLESEIDAAKSITAHTGRKIVATTIVLAVIAAGLLLFQLFRPKSSPAPRPASAELRRGEQSEAATAVPEKSIAVLPFDNLSRDPDNAYFSEGIQDEILTRLAKIAQLKVVSRTSTQKYRSAPDNLRDIAHQLGVANILEGSVQKAGDQVRVTVQLINAISDAHLWADSYDRKLTDIFSVESDIARTVAETLRAKLTGSAEQVLASKPTENPEAHQLYLKGRYFWNRRGAENLIKAINYFQQAIDKDPTYALAYAGLGDAHAILPIYAGSPAKDDVPKALVAARKAVELDDSLSEAHTCLANAMVMNVQLAASEPEFHKAIELNPNYATAHQWFGECLQGEGRFNEALAELKRAQELDPLSLIINGSYGTCLGMAGRSDEAIDQLHKTMEMDPTFTVAHVMLGQVLEDKGALSEAIAEYEKAMERYRTPATEAMLAHACVLTGRKAEAHKILDDLTNASRQHYVAAYPLAIVHLALGDKDEALRLLEKSFEQRCLLLQGNFGSLKTDRRLDPLRGDPRFQKLLERFLSGRPE